MPEEPAPPPAQSRRLRPAPTRTLTGRLITPPATAPVPDPPEPARPAKRSPATAKKATGKGNKAGPVPPVPSEVDGANGTAGTNGAGEEATAAGPELARAVLDAARARRVPTRRGSTGVGSGRRLQGYSGAGPDSRDPQPLGVVLARLMKARGWQQPAAEARLFGMWEAVVGAELAAHSRPVKLTEGELTVEAESTAWATQLRLLTAKLMVRISDAVGSGVVKKLTVHGPVAPSWVNGPRRVRGRGPRDTYG